MNERSKKKPAAPVPPSGLAKYPRGTHDLAKIRAALAFTLAYMVRTGQPPEDLQEMRSTLTKVEQELDAVLSAKRAEAELRAQAADPAPSIIHN